MTAYPSQDSFVKGEISPRLHSRAGIDLYRSALAICENFITMPHGGLRKRGGTYYAGATKNNAPVRMAPFIFSETQAYCLFFGHQHFRVYAYGAPVMNGPSVVEVVSPYPEGEVKDLQFLQSGDALYVTHPAYAPRKITRSAHTTWAIEVLSYTDGPFGSQNSDKTAKVYPSASTGSITLTANEPIFSTNMIDQLFKIEVETYTTWKPWEAGGYLTSATVAGITRRYNGNIYEAIAPTDAPGKISMGGTPPVHLEGSEWDGSGNIAETYSDVGDEYSDTYGVKWLYRHSGFGVVRIDTVDSGGLTATATVLRAFPTELVGSGNASYRWSVGGFGGTKGFPRSAVISEERLVYGQKFSVYGSKTFDFRTFQAGAADDDALSFQLAGTNDITWLQESDGFILIGTIGGVRTLSGGGNNEPLTPSKFKNRGSPTKKCSSIPPVKAGSTFAYIGFDRRSVVELNFSLEKNGYSTASLSLVSEHIPKAGLHSICYQAEPDPFFWMGRDDGQLAGLTYEADQNVRGWHRHKIGGAYLDGDDLIEHGIVEGVVSTPGQTGADDVWLVVKRTIDGATRRYIEIIQPAFEYGEIDDCFMVDSGVTYRGAPVNSVIGAGHLEAEFVTVMADGVVYRDIRVAGGVVTLPGGAVASRWVVGLPYTAVAETLELDVGGRDGSIIGRRKRVNSVILSVLESANIYVKSASRGSYVTEKAGRNTIAPPSDVVSPFTGNLDPVMIEDTWEGQGRIRIEAPDPVPATIRAIIPGFDSEGSN